MSGKELAYADLKPGHVFTETRYRISREDNEAFLGTVRYEAVRTDAGQVLPEAAVPTDRPIHPTLLGSYQPLHAAFSWPTGVLHAREQVSLLASAMPGEELASTVTVQECYERNGKKFVVLRITIDKVEDKRTAIVVERTLVWPY